MPETEVKGVHFTVRQPDPECLMNVDALSAGLTQEVLIEGMRFAYDVLDKLDERLLESELPRFSGLIELANLSSSIGNLLAAGIVKASNGIFEKAGPHKYQDLRATEKNVQAKNIEIKMALEDNAPKGHLAKEGCYLTCRYVLGDTNGACVRGKRGDVVWFWELRFGRLERGDFNLSNTAGDSGKTAVVNRQGMDKLRIVYLDQKKCPFGPRSRYLKALPNWQALLLK